MQTPCVEVLNYHFRCYTVFSHSFISHTHNRSSTHTHPIITDNLLLTNILLDHNVFSQKPLNFIIIIDCSTLTLNAIYSLQML